MTEKSHLPIGEIIRLYQDENSTYDIGKAYNIHASTIQRALRKQGFNLRQGSDAKLKGRRIPAEEIIQEYNDFNSANKISEKYKLSDTTIAKKLESSGVKVRNISESRLNERAIPDKDIKKLFLDGKTTPEIAEMYNVDYKTICRRLKKQGIVFRDLSELNKSRKKNIPAKEISNLINKGNSIEDLAKKYNSSIATIYSRLKEYGLKGPSSLKQVLDNMLTQYNQGAK